MPGIASPRLAEGRINVMKHLLTATFLSAAMLLPSMVQAMEIQKFDKMALQDQHDYIADLVIGAQKVLIDEGRSDLAAQVDKLFTETPAGDEIPLGLNEFESNLDRARVADIQRIQKNPDARRLEVEDAMIVTLRKNGIELPPSFLTVNSGFKPKHTPPAKEKKEKDKDKKN
jgi:hypothetical protein